MNERDRDSYTELGDEGQQGRDQDGLTQGGGQSGMNPGGLAGDTGNTGQPWTPEGDDSTEEGTDQGGDTYRQPVGSGVGEDQSNIA